MMVLFYLLLYLAHYHCPIFLLRHLDNTQSGSGYLSVSVQQRNATAKRKKNSIK